MIDLDWRTDLPLAFVCLAAPLAVGAVHGIVVLAIVSFLTIALVINVWFPGDDCGDDGTFLSMSLPALSFAFFASICLLQIVPLPAPLHRVLAPQRWEIFRGGWEALFGTAPNEIWRSLSFDPARTADRGMRWLALLLAGALVGIRRSSEGSRPTIRRVIWIAIVTGGVVLGVGIAQTLVGSQKILFWYEPEAAHRSLATFVNPNHASVFFGLVGLIAVGRTLDRRGTALRPALLAGVLGVAFITAAFLFDSFGGTFAMMVGVVVLVFGLLGGGKLGGGAYRDPSRKIFIGFTVAVLFVPVIALGAVELVPVWTGETAWRVFMREWGGQTAVRRAELISASLEGGLDYPFWGVGGGATERILPAYLNWSLIPPATIPVVENEPVEWFFHYGIFGVVGLVGVSGFIVIPLLRYLRRSRWRYALAVTLGVFLLGTAELHFPFFALGIAIPAVVVLEATGFARRRSTESAEESPGLQFRWKRGLVDISKRVARRGTIGIVLVLACFIAVYTTEQVELEEFDLGESIDWRHLVATVPSDGDVYALASIQSRQKGNYSEANRRAQYAFEREPTAKMAMIRARALAAAGETEKAVRAYRQVFSDRFPVRKTQSVHIPKDWVKYVIRDFSNAETIARALRNGRPDVIESASRILADRKGTPEVSKFALALVELRPQRSRPYRILIRAYIAMDREYADLAEIWARTFVRRADEETQDVAYALLAKTLRYQRQVDEAWKILRGVTRPITRPFVAREVFALLDKFNGETSKSDAVLVSSAVDIACSRPSPTWRRRCTRGEGWLAEWREDFTHAERAYRRLAVKYGGVEEYGEFLVRRDRCRELTQFRDSFSKHRDGYSKSDKKIRKLKKLTTECGNPE